MSEGGLENLARIAIYFKEHQNEAKLLNEAMNVGSFESIKQMRETSEMSTLINAASTEQFKQGIAEGMYMALQNFVNRPLRVIIENANNNREIGAKIVSDRLSVI